MLDIYIPTFGRSHKLATYLPHINEATQTPHQLICIVEATDLNSYHEAVKAGAIAIINHRTGNYAGAINSAWECMHSEIFMAAADDLKFYPGWEIEALKKMVDPIKVVGTNDLHNQEVARGEHATHYLIKGDYIKNVGGVADKSAPVLPECYDHNWTDREAILTAQKRGVFTPCLESIVEHLHFTFGLSPMDDTYKKTRRAITTDQQLFISRKHLWS